MEKVNKHNVQLETIDTKGLIIKDSLSYLSIKRTIDISVSFFGIILLFPLFLLISALIKLEDPKGSIFFKQIRVGKNEKQFYMYKFRSMVSNAEDLLDNLRERNEVSGAMFKIKKDPRVTKIGKFIRKTSVDELPQLLNVLKGDMSLVGPRPPLPREVLEYTKYHKQRLRIKPGCTGLWQVSARNNVSFGEMVEMDIKYMKNRSTIFDISLILKTIVVMISSKAY